MRPGLGAGAAEDDAGDAEQFVDEAGDFVVVEVEVKVVGWGVIGEILTEGTEEKDDVTEGLLVVVAIVVAIVVFALVKEDAGEDWLLVLDTVDDAELLSSSDPDGTCEPAEEVVTDDCVAVSVGCVMGLEFGTPWHTSYTEAASAMNTSEGQAEARQTKASSPSVKPETLLLVHKQLTSC